MKDFLNSSRNPTKEKIARTLQNFIKNYLKFGKDYEEFEKHIFSLRSNPKTEKIVENIITNNIRNLSLRDFENITKDGAVLVLYGSAFLEYGEAHKNKDFINLALQIFVKLKIYFKNNTSNYARTLMYEGNARRNLAALGVESIENLGEAIKLFQRAMEEGLIKNTPDYAKALMYEGIAKNNLAELGVESIKNLTEARKLFGKARKEGFTENTPDFARALLNEGIVKFYLALFGVDSIENLTEAVKLCQRARKKGFKENTSYYAGSLMNEGGVRTQLALFGVDSIENLTEAVKLFERAREEGLVKNTTYYAMALLNEGAARSDLGAFGVDSVENLREAIKLYQRAREEGFTRNTPHYAGALMNEGEARSNLAKLGVKAIENLTEAIKLFERAREEGFIENTPDHASILLNEGEARSNLARFGVDSVENLTEAIKLYQRSRKEGFDENTPYYALSLNNEGFTRVDLAKLDVEREENLGVAMKLFQRAREEGFIENTPDHASTMMNEGKARKQLAEIGVEKEENLRKAMKLYESAREVFEGSNNKIRLIEVDSDIGDLNYFTGEFAEGYPYLREAVGLIEGIRSAIKIPELRRKYFETVVDVYKTIVFTCLALGRDEEAFGYAEAAKGRVFLELLASEKKRIRGDPELVKKYKEILRKIEEIEGRLFKQKREETAVKINDYDKLKDLRGLHDHLLLEIKEGDPEYYSVEQVEPVTLEELRKFLNGKTLVEYFLGRDKLAVFIVNKGLIVKVLDVSEREVQEKVDQFLGLIRRMELLIGMHLVIDWEFGELEGWLRDFYKVLVEPIEEYFGEEIIFVPHSYLHYVPFLAFKDGDGKYLIEKFKVCFVQSASSLKFLERGLGEGALVVGNPTGELKFAKEEALEVAKLLGVRPLIGRDAKKDIVLEEIIGKNLVHFSCHGKFDAFRPSHSRIILADGKSISAVEFMDLDLDAELMVLSACKTAMSRVGMGDEVEGLVRAIQYGGCRFVIASLWSVPERSTMELFLRFYKEEGDIVERFRKAQLTLIKSYSFFNWAPFQIYGF